MKDWIESKLFSFNLMLDQIEQETEFWLMIGAAVITVATFVWWWLVK